VLIGLAQASKLSQTENVDLTKTYSTLSAVWRNGLARFWPIARDLSQIMGGYRPCVSGKSGYNHLILLGEMSVSPKLYHPVGSDIVRQVR
jgi:hypothetical protein